MTAATVAVALGVLNVVALAGLIANRVWWQIKLALILACAALTFLTWHALEDFEGWPADAKPDGELVASLTVEPSSETEGAIYLWLRVGGREEPRAFRTPYTRKGHEETHRAQQAASQGVRVHARLRDGQVRDGDVSPLRFYVLPPVGPGDKQ